MPRVEMCGELCSSNGAHRADFRLLPLFCPVKRGSQADAPAESLDRLHGESLHIAICHPRRRGTSGVGHPCASQPNHALAPLRHGLAPYVSAWAGTNHERLGFMLVEPWEIPEVRRSPTRFTPRSRAFSSTSEHGYHGTVGKYRTRSLIER